MSLILLAAAYIVKDKKVLLIQQMPHGDQGNKWGPPAGHAEPEENLIDTAVRETKEETNLDIEITGIIRTSYLKDNEKEYLAVLYQAKAKNSHSLRVKKDEVQNFHWATLSDLKSDKYPMRKKFLETPAVLALTNKPNPLTSFEKITLESD